MKISLRKGRRESHKSPLREWVESLVSTVVFVWIFTNHVAQATEVPTESMQPAIMPGDHFFLDKLAFPANYPQSIQRYLPDRAIHRGDIIAFWSPENRDMRLVKRVIALPGETVEIRDRQVYINGSRLDEPYKIHIGRQYIQQRDNFGPAVVPANQYFMLGDNRDNSNDSRFWGFAHHEDFIGKPTFVYWSYDVDPREPLDKSIGEWVAHYASVTQHFLTRTRWSRTGEFLK